MVQWLGLHALTAKGLDSVPGWRTKFPQAMGSIANKKKKKKKKKKTGSERLYDLLEGRKLIC